jgi:ubiquitin-protein ligase E3 A
LLDWKEDNVDEVFCLTFSVTVEAFGKVLSIDLVPGGSDLPVTLSNRKEYVRLYKDYICSIQVWDQFNKFKQGFIKVCGGPVLQMCRPAELELLLCGGETEVDIYALKEHVQYDDGFEEDHPVIIWFWEIVQEFTPDMKRNLLNFVTSSHRVPLGGFKLLLFVIQRNGPDTDRLPSSLTCFGRLLLPEYASKEKLKDRLVTALENSQGFGLV